MNVKQLYKRERIAAKYAKALGADSRYIFDAIGIVLKQKTIDNKLEAIDILLEAVSRKREVS